MFWFRLKTVGYGATPNTWQGWLLTIGSLVALAGVVMTGAVIRDNLMRVVWPVFGVGSIALSLIWIAKVKTEGGLRRNE